MAKCRPWAHEWEIGWYGEYRDCKRCGMTQWEKRKAPWFMRWSLTGLFMGRGE